jgi:hypothetical protein
MSEVRLAGLVAVRVAWITAIVVCALVILIGWLTGTDGGNSSQQLPEFAFNDGGDSSQQSPEFALLDPAAALVGAAAQEDRSGWAKEGAIGDGHPESGVPPRLGGQPDGAGGGTPVVTPRQKPPQAPEGDPAEAPQEPSVAPPKPPKEPSVAPPKPPKEPSVAPPKPPKEPSVAPPKPPKEPSVAPPKPPKEPSVAPPKPPKA